LGRCCNGHFSKTNDEAWILARSVHRTTWTEFLKAGGFVSGFPESRWKTVQQVRLGDYLLCYLTGVSRFIGVLEVVKAPYKDTTQRPCQNPSFSDESMV
jgi:EVE domain